MEKHLLDQRKRDILVATIQQKRELQGINQSLVQAELISYLKKNQKIASHLTPPLNQKSANYEKIIKEVRAALRKKYGLFRNADNIKKIASLLQELFHSSPSQWQKILLRILATHSSAQERISFYQDLYFKLFQITGKPKTILDLGCGLNPFSLPLMRLNELDYYAYDIHEEEIHHLNLFFNFWRKNHHQFQGRAEMKDITKAENIIALPHADVCFLFKVTDILDQGRGHKKTEEVVTLIPARYVVISFPTKTMSGRKMNAPQRKWMGWLCRRLNYSYTVLEFENEIFYVVEKK